MINAGVDFKLWNGLLSGSADVFYRQRKGLPAQKANDNAGALATWYNLDLNIMYLRDFRVFNIRKMCCKGNSW